MAKGKGMMKKKQRIRFYISPGFLVSLAVLLYFDRQGILIWLLPGCIVHEAAHWAALRLAGGGVSEVRLTISGVAMELRHPDALSYPGELAAALAGPLANLFLALTAALLGRWVTAPVFYLFSGLNLGLMVWNLLPAEPLDGGRALSVILSWLVSPACAGLVLRITTLLTAVVMTVLGFYALGHGGGFTLLTTGLWLLLKPFDWRKGVVNRRVSI
jgi:Zn-dependent protease